MAQGLSVKLDSFLKPFRGRGDNFQTFWSKFLVLADANGWECFFPGMADACRKFVHKCTACQEANPRSSERPQPTRPVSPGRPTNRSGRYHCVLVAVDVFTKWVEVRPLERHDANSVAAAFFNMCCDFGAPRVARCGNGTEFRNAIVAALFEGFGVAVAHGAVRHPQSQGAAECFNQTLLTLIRKVLDTADFLRIANQQKRWIHVRMPLLSQKMQTQS